MKPPVKPLVKSSLDALIVPSLMAAFGLALPWYIHARHWLPLFPPAPQLSPGIVLGALAFSAALPIFILNFYLGVVGPALLKLTLGKKKGDRKTAKFRSPVPLIGSLAIFASAAFLPPHPVFGGILLVSCLMDTGGITWMGYRCLKEQLKLHFGSSDQVMDFAEDSAENPDEIIDEYEMNDSNDDTINKSVEESVFP
ncbi:MAG: hypothetical protein CVV64_15975 [Candidatus Wallbacteria bacterium HGW-Wallbacteria-1]|jgi:hypothetical protein|uniref:Uncharacterized protein n=1 Tax=Candidatus Wallbacteria bacterium HGW-Wallbacteria-1 TaxID=2013854 RepID=A0A2N1PL38_9BACT|nr:MAG: hypothetical protein CVV64_15975 [Candidatus Wallbacteria bacterium HGW-Wallbacteria-1]